MKFTDLKVRTEYAVIPAWDYSSQEKKNPNMVRRSAVAKAELVSLDKYDYKVYRSDRFDDPSFTPAPKGSRTVGYLVKSSDWAGSGNADVYWLARPQDIVAVYSTLEERWVVEEKAEIERELRVKQEREDRERKEREVMDRQQRLSDACMNGLKAILGDRATAIKAEISNRRSMNGDYTPQARFEIDVITMQILIEKVLEAQEAVA